VTEPVEAAARRIADRGRDALLARLRPAFVDAANTHADVLKLSDDQLEEMVQRAVDRADGLQWRRALAEVATEELGISLGEALGHPAVTRAQELVGAPSYEEGLSAVGLQGAASAFAEPERTQSFERGSEPDSIPGPAPDPDSATRTATASEIVKAEDLAGPFDVRPAPDPQWEFDPLPGPTPGALDPAPIRVAAIHLGGVANLPQGASDLELQLTEHGLDIIRGAGETLGRLSWNEIRTIEVPTGRGVRRRRREPRTSLVVRTTHGKAGFAIPGVSAEELREHVDPLVHRYAR
jgi:hypothetical protein